MATNEELKFRYSNLDYRIMGIIKNSFIIPIWVTDYCILRRLELRMKCILLILQGRGVL